MENNYRKYDSNQFLPDFSQNTGCFYPVPNNENSVPIVNRQPVNNQLNDNVTSINDLRSYANGSLVKLPDFGEGQPFVARMKRPSLLAMAAAGKIPNKLLVTANELFNKGSTDSDNENSLKDMYDVCRIICDSALIEPTMEQIESCGLELSDEQLIAIFSYTQQGVKALDSFR